MSRPRTQHEINRQHSMGAPGEVWWNGQNYYYFAYLLGGPRPSDIWIRMYRIDSMPSIPHNVKKGSIIASAGWRFVCTYFHPDFMWTVGRGINGGQNEQFWQKAFVSGIQRYRGVNAQTGRDYYVYDYDQNPPNWEGRPQVAYPTNAVGNLENHNNGINYNRRRQRWRLNTTFVHHSNLTFQVPQMADTRVCICVGQLWRRSRIPAREGNTINGGPIKAVKYWRARNGLARPERRNYELFDNGPYLHGNSDSGRQVMIIDILGVGNKDTDHIFYACSEDRPWREGTLSLYDIIHVDHARFQNRRIYATSASEFYQLFNIARRPNERQTNQTDRVRQPIRRQNAMEIEDEKPPLAERLQAVRWNKDWGYGADFIQWTNRERTYHADLTGDSSGSGSSGGVDPNHPHQRAKATSEPERQVTTEHYVYVWKLVEIPNELRMEWQRHRENTPRIPIRIGDAVIRKEGEDNWDPNPELRNDPYFPQPDTIMLVQARAGIGEVNLYQLNSRGINRGMYDVFSIAKLIMPPVEMLKKAKRWARVKKNMQWGMNDEMFKAKIKF